jgi:hypothetical protein
MRSPSLHSLVRSLLLEADDPEGGDGHPLHDRAHQIAQRLEDPDALAAAASQETMIGRGGNSTAHAIPGEEGLVLRVPIRGGYYTSQGDAGPLRAERVHNPFGDINVGQALARVGSAEVLLRQAGEPAGMTHSEPAAKRKDWVDVYRARVVSAAQMPQSAYDGVASDLLRVNELGYVFDPSKSNNILIDPAGRRFGLVDINPRSPRPESEPEYVNTAADVVVCLVGNAAASYDEAKLIRDDLVAPRREIIRKMMLAADRTGLPRGETILLQKGSDPVDNDSLRWSKTLAGMR